MKVCHIAATFLLPTDAADGPECDLVPVAINANTFVLKSAARPKDLCGVTVDGLGRHPGQVTLGPEAQFELIVYELD